MNLPKRLLLFWYPHAAKTFVRSWVNTISVLEEDLGVGIMWKLLFVPMFHDSSITGRVMSFFFRLSRIFIGLLSYACATLFFMVLALIWFFFPVLFIIPITRVPAVLIFLFGVTLFIDRVALYPPIKVWQLNPKLNNDQLSQEIWQSTKLKPADLNWAKLTQSFEVKNLLASLELTPDKFLGKNPTPGVGYYQAVKDLAKSTGAKYFTEGYFWVVMYLQQPETAQELLAMNLKAEDFTGALNFMEHKRLRWRTISVWDEDFAVKHLKGTNRGWLSAPTPNLDSVAEDLTKQAASRGFPDFVGRTAQLQETVSILSTQNGRNVIIVAQPGTGKTTMINYLAKMIVTGDAPKALANKRLVSLDITRLLAGVKSEGDLADKVKNVFEEVKFVQDIIVYVDEIQNLGVGDAGSNFNLYSLLLPHIESNEFQFIASTEPENYTKILEKNGAFARLFTKIDLPAATVPETIYMVQEEAINLAHYKKIEISYLAIKELVELAGRLIHDRVLPDSALTLLNEAETMAQSGRITSQTIKEVLGKRVNIPVQELGTAQKAELLKLEDAIHQRMIDQEQAVSAIANTLRRAATSLREQNRPIGSFLFVGPTGVGKTELAKALATVYFKNSAAFVRFDMSEYQTPEAINRLLGDFNNPGELTEAIRNKPYSLILLDEFEKADTKITTLFLQVLDDGRLTDASGRTVDFTNTIIIATSNAASLTIAQGLEHGVQMTQLKQQVNDELLKIYKPELVNRFDEVVIFKPLSQQDLQQIVVLKLREIQAQLKEQGYLIDFSPELIAVLAQRGFDPVLGARPLRRLIQDTLEARMSKLMLENRLVKGQLFRVGVELMS